MRIWRQNFIRKDILMTTLFLMLNFLLPIIDDRMKSQFNISKYIIFDLPNGTMFNHNFQPSISIYTNSEFDFKNCPFCTNIKKTNFSNSSQRDVVITYASSSLKNVFPFIRSLRSTGCKATVVFLIDDEAYKAISHDTFDLLKNCSVKVINFGKLKNKIGHPQIYALKHLSCYDFLIEYYALFDRVLLIDLYDVYFQKDPFTPEIGYDRLYVAEEFRQIGHNDKYNFERVQKIYKIPKSLYGRTTLNAGILYGSPYVLLNFYKLYFSMFDVKRLKETHITCDQGYLNYFMLTDQLNKEGLNFKGLSYRDGYHNLASIPRDWFMKKDFTFGNLTLNNYEQVVVHQYDRSRKITYNLLANCPQGNYNVTPADYVREMFVG